MSELSSGRRPAAGNEIAEVRPVDCLVVRGQCCGSEHGSETRSTSVRMSYDALTSERWRGRRGRMRPGWHREIDAERIK